VHIQRFVHEATNSAVTEFQLQNRDSAQPLQWVIRSVTKQPVSALTLEINGRQVVALKDQTVPPGGSLKFTDGSEAVLSDSNWKELARIPVELSGVQVGTGSAQIRIGCTLQKDATLKIELRTLTAATRIGSK